MRIVGSAWWVQFKLLSRSPFFVGLSLTTPLAFSTISLLMAPRGDPEIVTAIVFGSGLLGAWSATLFGAGESLYMQRFTGTLGMIATSPAGLFRPVVGFALGSATLGVYSIVAVVVWATAVFDVALVVANPVGVVLSLVASFVSLIAIGIVLATYYVLSRQAMAVSNLLEYPVWILCGVLVPASVLWPPLEVLGKILPLGWATEAVRAAVNGGDWLIPSLVAFAISGGYLAIGRGLLVIVETKVRVTGELELR